MDYRHREYYLVHFNLMQREIYLNELRSLVLSLKMHKPYNHILYDKEPNIEYDGKWWRFTELKHIDMMLSCKKEEAKKLEYELNRLNNENKYGLKLKRCKFYRLTKEFCRQ